jgi:hypothetical protein
MLKVRILEIKRFEKMHNAHLGQLSFQRWKSQRKKIHRLAYRFSIDLKIYRLANGFLCVNHKGLAKVYRFLVPAFFSRDFGIFGCFESVSSMFHFDLH